MDTARSRPTAAGRSQMKGERGTAHHASWLPPLTHPATTGVAILAVAGSIQAAWTTSAAAVLAYYGLTNLAAHVAARRDRRPVGIVIGAAGGLGCLVLALALPGSAWIPTIAVAAIGIGVATIQQRVATASRVP